MKSLFNCPGAFLTYCTRHSLRVPGFFPVSVFFHIALVVHFFCDNVLELDNFSPLIGIKLEFIYYSLQPSAGLFLKT